MTVSRRLLRHDALAARRERRKVFRGYKRTACIGQRSLLFIISLLPEHDFEYSRSKKGKRRFARIRLLYHNLLWNRTMFYGIGPVLERMVMWL